MVGLIKNIGLVLFVLGAFLLVGCNTASKHLPAGTLGAGASLREISQGDVLVSDRVVGVLPRAAGEVTLLIRELPLTMPSPRIACMREASGRIYAVHTCEELVAIGAYPRSLAEFRLLTEWGHKFSPLGTLSGGLPWPDMYFVVDADSQSRVLEEEVRLIVGSGLHTPKYYEAEGCLACRRNEAYLDGTSVALVLDVSRFYNVSSKEWSFVFHQVIYQAPSKAFVTQEEYRDQGIRLHGRE